MKFVLKFILGVSVLLAVIVLFTCSQRTDRLDTLKHWLAASHNDRVTRVQMAIAGDGDIDLIVQCVDKIATISTQEAGTMDVNTAIMICNTGNAIKDNT